MNKVLIVAAPSGSGKTTLVHHLLWVFPQLQFSVSATTRKPRLNEVDGRDYHFITEDEFKKRISNNEFVEYEEVYPGSFYGTLESELKKIWANNKIVVFDVDVKGGVSLKEKFGEAALSVFIKPPSIDALKQRLLNRASESIDKIEIRVNKSIDELKSEPHFDVTIINDKLNIAQMEIEKVVSDFIAAG